jgi:pimeloyl-ACP methyl ester carboxylesterase
MSLERAGVATLRINFRGEGDRLRTNIKSTLHSRVEDTENAYRFLTQKDGLASGKIGVYGSSLGATTAIVPASRHPDWFTTLAVWSSPSGDQGPGMMEGGLKNAAREAMATGTGSFHFEGWKTVTFERDFFESFEGVDLDAALAKIPGAFLTVRGTEDFLPVRDREMVSLSGGNPRESVLIGGADHIFNIFDPEKDYHQRAVAATTGWFIRTLNAPSGPN